MRRAGERGENKWQHIGWGEALDEVAHNLTELQKKYAPQSLVMIGHGTWKKPYHRLAHALGIPNITS